jgi:pimeloyl-ACP methyl ester carboxylesterase
MSTIMDASYLSQFFYTLSGPENGRKWVFLHGLMGYASNWRKVLSGMASERVLAFDQRGHGRSFKPASGYASEDYADDLFKISEELGWESFILVGHSMGGRNALAFAHKYPHKVQKLVIEDIGPESSPQAIDYYEKLLGAVPTPFSTKLQAKEFFMNEWPSLGVVHENILALGQYLYSNLEDKADGSVDWRFSKQAIMASVVEGRAKDVWHELRSLTMPTLVIRGENSKELSSEVFQRMCVANPGVRGVQILNAGHWVHADQSQEFLRNILEFANT